MSATAPRRPREEVARLGDEVFRTRIQPTLSPDDDGKYVVIDIDTGEFEIDENDYQAYERLNARRPGAEMFLARAGFPTAGVLRTPR